MTRLAFHVLHASLQTDVIREIRQMALTSRRDPNSRTRLGETK